MVVTKKYQDKNKIIITINRTSMAKKVKLNHQENSLYLGSFFKYLGQKLWVSNLLSKGVSLSFLTLQNNTSKSK